jgi:N-acetyl-1-D-myo-inositol-2-amino-2-deoxy-alpha-D-glucopyranoside deacetylase
MAAVEAAADPAFRPELGEPWQVAKVYWGATPRSVVRRGIEALAALGERSPFENLGDLDEVPFVVPDELVTTAVDARAHAGAKHDAMRAHATQITVAEPWFALSNDRGQLLTAVECYRLARGRSAAPAGTVETDLFAGVTAR